MTAKVAIADGSPGWMTRLPGQRTRPPSVPAGRRVFAVGDIHGKFDLLTALMAKIHEAADGGAPARNVLVLLGDYIDRGAQSKEVVEFLSAFSRPGWEAVSLCGNHEQAFLDFLDDPNSYRGWRGFGAPETLLSYGVMPPRFEDEQDFVRARDELAAKCPPSHLRFLRALKDAHEEGDYLFVHAGIRPGVPLDRQAREDLLWIREPFLLSTRLFDKIVVHGHTPAEGPVVRRNRIGLDTGAYATGCLTAAVLEEQGIRFLSTAAKAATEPPVSTSMD